MGTFRVPMEVSNFKDGRKVTVEALAGTGSGYSVVPAPLLEKIGIEPLWPVTFRGENGEPVQHDTGPAAISLEGNTSICRVVFGEEDQCIVGELTLEALLLAVDLEGEHLVEGEMPTL